MRAQQSRRGLLVAVAFLVVSLSGCDDTPTAGPAGPPVSTTPPAVGACYRLDVADGLRFSSNAPRVSCTTRHTSITVAVRRVKRPTDRSAPPIRSPRVQRQISQSCKSHVDRYVGGTAEARRLSRIQAVWFSPTPAQVAAGARWFRCDLVIAGNQTSLVALPHRTRGLLDNKANVLRYGTCGNAAPGTDGFRRVRCSGRHAWRARASISLPPGTTFLGAAAAKRADSACRDIEAQRATTATRLRWSFEWPTRPQWVSGQRYGLCWTPD